MSSFTKSARIVIRHSEYDVVVVVDFDEVVVVDSDACLYGLGVMVVQTTVVTSLMQHIILDSCNSLIFPRMISAIKR